MLVNKFFPSDNSDCTFKISCHYPIFSETNRNYLQHGNDERRSSIFTDNAGSTSTHSTDLATSSISCETRLVHPWFTSVTDYSFIDDYRKGDHDKKTSTSDYSDEFNKLFAEVALLKSRQCKCKNSN